MLQTYLERYHCILSSIEGTIIKEADRLLGKKLIVVIGWQPMQRLHRSRSDIVQARVLVDRTFRNRPQISCQYHALNQQGRPGAKERERGFSSMRHNRWVA